MRFNKVNCFGEVIGVIRFRSNGEPSPYFDAAAGIGTPAFREVTKAWLLI